MKGFLDMVETETPKVYAKYLIFNPNLNVINVANIW